MWCCSSTGPSENATCLVVDLLPFYLSADFRADLTSIGSEDTETDAVVAFALLNLFLNMTCSLVTRGFLGAVSFEAFLSDRVVTD